MSFSRLSDFSVTPTRGRLAISLLTLLITVLLATGYPAAAQDSTRTKQLRLLCVQLSGDLTDPGGMAAFRRCLTAHDPLEEMRRQNNVGHLRVRRIMDRPSATPPRGYGRNSRAILAQAIQRFQTTDGKVIYVVATDGRLWRSTTGTKDARVLDKSVVLFRVTRDGHVFVLGRDDALWREGEGASPRTLIEQRVADFQPLDNKVIYVRGTDGKLWRETGNAPNRTLVDKQVASFQAVDASVVYVLSSDGKLWRETGGMNTRALVAGAVKAFEYVPDGNTAYVLTTVDGLWRKAGSQKPEQVDRDVAAFHAVDMNLVYVLGQDGRLWKVLGNRDQAVLVDSDAKVSLGQAAFQILDAQHVFIIDEDHKLWAESMPPGR
jgi:hypothetical protein